MKCFYTSSVIFFSVSFHNSIFFISAFQDISEDQKKWKRKKLEWEWKKSHMNYLIIIVNFVHDTRKSKYSRRKKGKNFNRVDYYAKWNKFINLYDVKKMHKSFFFFVFKENLCFSFIWNSLWFFALKTIS